MEAAKDAAKYVPRCLTVPLRFRIPKDDYELLREYAKANDYSIGNLSRAIIKSWVEAKIKKPMREAERQRVEELFPDE